MRKRLGVGFIGAGAAGIGHIRTFAGCPDARLVCVADPDAAGCERAAGAADGLECVDDHAKMLRRDDVDLVVVSTPHNLHRSMVVETLRAGKHVFCEKPLAMNAAECDEMIAAANETGRRLLVFQTQRFGAAFHRLKRIVDENDMGRLLFGVVVYLGNELERMHDPVSWKGTYERAGGGVLLDGGCHVVDLCNWYFGRPVSVMAQTSAPADWPEHKGELTGELLIAYEDGTIAQVLASFEARLKNQGGLKITAELFYENGSAYGEYAHLGGQRCQRLARYVDGNGKEHAFELSDKDGVNYAQHVLDCLLNNTSPIVTAEEARMAVAVVEAAYESARTGQRVAVPPLPG